jgi:flagellar biosynthesis/type III secretory pathway M-ring protein FliF/YscJ
MTPITEILLKHGLPGVAIIVLILVVRELYQRLREEHEKRLEDQKQATTALLAMADKTHAALDKTGDVLELTRNVLELVRHQPAVPPFQTNLTSGTRLPP